MTKHRNTLIGWGLFTLSFIVYMLSLAKTVSFWDCGEFLSAAYKLQIGHPPGAPLYLMIARIFSAFAPNAKIATILINAVSAIASAATVMFLYWTIVLLLKPVYTKQRWNENLISIGAAIGALTFAFTDSFWFSAVEAEVYALSSFFTAVVFWAILKWREETDSIYSRWILLIFYMLGLSIGVHLLNLLAIPAIVFVIYHHKWKVNNKNSLLALGVSGALVVAINYGIIPGIPWLISRLELIAVNSLHLPQHTGIFLFFGVFLISLIFLNRYSISRGKQRLNLITNSTALLIIGYGCYAMVVIRTNANPSLNENAPKDMFRLQEYLNREQYGDRPLFYGNYYTAPVVGQKSKGTKYFYDQGKYKKQKGAMAPIYDKRFNTFFPRMYSSRGQHPEVYQSWTGENGSWLNTKTGGLNQKIYKPSFVDNFTFFTTYQLGNMYFRYFMWNFAGRQNDKQGYGDILNGNWISGVKSLDHVMVGDSSKRPDYPESRKGENTYLFLPLILGLIGLYIQMTTSNKEMKDFTPLVLLFISTGIAIVIYLNQTPIQARERDYAYVGSFYTFAIWIGLGAFYLLKGITKKKQSTILLGICSLMLLVALPGRMLQQNWDDHDRSDRMLAQNLSSNILNPLEKNGILFTYGDNDTFPLWYTQEVRNERTDIRICNTSLLSTNWYIKQMQQQKYDSPALPIHLNKGQKVENIREYIPVLDNLKKPFEIKQLIQFWIGSKDIRTKVKTRSGEKIDYIPSKTIALPVTKEVVRSGFLKGQLKNKTIKDTLFIPLKGSGIFKSDLMLLNMLAHYQWDRPISFDPSALEGIHIDLTDFVRFDGLTYTLIPYEFKKTEGLIGEINTERSMQTIKDYQWEQLGDKKVFWDETSLRTLKSAKVKNAYTNTLVQMIAEKETTKAKELFSIYEGYASYTPGFINKEDLPLATLLLKNKMTKEGEKLLSFIFNEAYQWTIFYTTLPEYLANSYSSRIQSQISILSQCIKISKESGCDKGYQQKLDDQLKHLIQLLE